MTMFRSERRQSSPWRSRHTLFALVSGVSAASAALLSTSSAHAAGPSRDECIAAADDGQKLRDDGKLSAARDKFVVCATKTCPAIIAKSCAGWRDDADRDMPSITFRVLDEQGKEIIDAKVGIDTATEQPISAKAAPLDPGEHVVHVRRADGKTTDEKFLLRPGEKNRMIEVHFTAPPVPVPPPKPLTTPGTTAASDGFHVPLLGWVGLGVFVAGGVTTTVFAVMAKSDESDLRSRGCAPSCPSSDKDGINTKILVANVGMGVGIAGLGLAVVTTVLANTGNKSATTGSAGTTQSTKTVQSGGVSALHVDASPNGMWLSGSF